MSQSNKMSVMQLTILTAVNMMGSGIIMLPTKLAQVGALSMLITPTAFLWFSQILRSPFLL